ncbi:MAG: hypothetical protein CVU05_10865 [Bacteroidetes bacterium HGW-Bacteroidetes-21]|nr:MAG: hypothetical protein CVU05_10865 [Bacteroidetes bacterium HGW-Bacteroidetes-21]
MLINCILPLLFIASLHGGGNDTMENLYDQSYQVFTGILVNKYEKPTTFQYNSGYMAEFDVTEIQKGSRRLKILIHDEVPDSLTLGREYLIFMIHVKQGKNKINVPIAIFTACPNCENKEIKEVYSIVKRKPFRRVKPPLSEYSVGRGCGCY